MDTSLRDPAYLLSTVEAITGSTVLHDLLDAYATFTNRVRSQSHLLDACHLLPPALAPLKANKDAFVRALRRDVRLAHIDPLSIHPRSALNDPSLGNTLLFDIRLDTKQYARESSLLCHHALCVLTTIFRFPAFHLVFPEHDLSALFGDALDIALANQLPILNQAKTYSLSLWVLSSHRLPLNVLASRRNVVFSVLQRSLDVTRQPGNILLDGLKAVSHTIKHHPSEFLDLLFSLLPHVMTNLHCKSSELRLHASVALGKFANALIHQTELTMAKWRVLSNHIMSYLEFEFCCDESQVAPGDSSFSHMVRAAFSAESYGYPTVAPTWILAVLASLIILCGPALYTKPTVLRFILRTLAIALTHKRSIVRALHPHVWRCFVWTFSRMLFSSEDVEPALISSAFYVIKQEVSGGIGMTLATVLLSDQVPAIRSDERSDRVSQALSVVKAMVRTECKHTRQEGFTFLQALTNTRVRHQISQNMYEYPAPVLLNGAVIRAKWDSLPSTIHSIPKVSVSVHWPEDAEIVRHYKTLLAIWKHVAIKAGKNEWDPDLADVWLSVLLACSHELECGQPAIVTTGALRHTAAVIVEFLPPAASVADCRPDQGSWNVHDQLCSLTFIVQLWFAMRKAFVAFSLMEAAELILSSMLNRVFHILDPGVRILWSRLCASLMATASPSFLRNIRDFTSPQMVGSSQRGLWDVVAISLSSPELDLAWKELVKFLAIPICTWALSKPELEAWEGLLRCAITLSGDFGMVTEHFVLQHLLGKEVETWESVMAVLGLFLTCTYEHENSPNDDLLSIIDGCLITSYSRAGRSPEALMHALELLNIIRHVVVSSPGKTMHILQALRSSLCLWIKDHSEVMSDDEFNSVVVPLYCETLEALEVLPLSVQSLQDMEDFLVSAFSRIPTPAIAPFAFEKFWRATYHGHSQFRNVLPSKIKSCLASFVAAYGGDLADGLSLVTGSESQSIGGDPSASATANTDGFRLESNGPEVHFPTSHQHQQSVQSSLLVRLTSTCMNAGARAKASDVEVAPHRQQQVFTAQADTPFPVPPSDHDAPQPTVLRELQGYSSRMDASFPSGSERSTSDPQMLSLPGFPRSASPSSYALERQHSVTPYVPHQKRKLADGDDAPQKRSRTTCDNLRSVRKLGSEPATHTVTPINAPRMNSVPLKKRKVFDGVEVPIVREISRRKRAQRAGTNKHALCAKTPPPSSYSVWREGTPRPASPPSVASDEESLDWEDFCVDGTSSEADVDRSLAVVHYSSPMRTETSAPHERDHEPHLRHGLSLCSVTSQSKKSSSPTPTRPSLQTTKTTSARLDALRDVYASVANGASQIPMSELVQAAKLVHQIDSVLAERMGKKMGGFG